MPQPAAPCPRRYNIGKYLGFPSLVCFNTGRTAVEVEKKSDADIKAAALAGLKSVYGNKVRGRRCGPTGWLACWQPAGGGRVLTGTGLGEACGRRWSAAACFAPPAPTPQRADAARRRASVPLQVAAPKETIITRWAQEPGYWGAYSYMAVGSTSADLEQMAENVASRLFFAGEATHQVGLGAAQH